MRESTEDLQLSRAALLLLALLGRFFRSTLLIVFIYFIISISLFVLFIMTDHFP